MKLLSLVVWCAFLAGGSVAVRGQVTATLVAEDASVQPGRPITVALHLVHEPHWHTYWVNPGTGLVTAVNWVLPAGWKAGPIQWPSPEILTDGHGNITGNGYQGELLLPVTLTPPPNLAPGSKMELKATANWLMCRDVCMPGEAAVSLALPVSADTPAPDPQWGAKIRDVVANLPSAESGWAVLAERNAKNVRLSVVPAGARDGTHQPEKLHFFADDNLVGYELPQTVESDGKGGFILTLPISPDGPQNASKLSGVLTSQNGWRPDGSLPGLRIDAPFAALAAEAEGSGSASAVALGGTLLLAFIGGAILNLMPCVFPVLGIKVLGFVNQAGTERRRVIAHGLIFTGGVVLSFWVLAGLLAVLRRGGDELGWGFQLQSPAFVFGLAAVILIFALNLGGVFEFGLSATSVGSGLQMKTGYAGSFFTGVLATVVATPCSAPFLAPALGAALSLTFGESFAIFTAIAIGLSAPYLLLSLFPGAVRVLPRPGAWMETFKQLMAFPLYATLGYLLWVLAGQVEESRLLGVFFGLVIIAMGVWAYGRFHAAGATAGRARFGLAACVVLLAAGAWIGWPRPAAPTDITWEKWSPEAVGRLRAGGRVIYVDFTARWCATCQANKAVVFHSPEVLKSFRDRHVAALRGDWTNRDPQITAELARYHRSAVPFNVIWLPGRNDPVILPPLLTPGIVLNALSNPK